LETIVAHAAIYKVGAIAVPLFSLFGPDAILHRLADSAARVLIADESGVTKLESIASSLLPTLQWHLNMDDASTGRSGWGQIGRQSADFNAVMTAADDPALIIYTSGTTGPSKGALHSHRVLLGHLPGVEMSHGGLPHEGDCLWTPADWAWIGGLLDVLLPALHHGIPVVAKRFEKFDAAAAFQLMEDCRIRNVFLPPTALKMLREVSRPRDRWKFSLRSIASGGESLGKELLRWSEEEFGIAINEFYGQTECNMVISSCSAWFVAQPGAIGKAVPGHELAVVDDEGNELPYGAEGHIAVRSPDPVMFLGYWHNEEETRQKFIRDWLITGDRGFLTNEGFIHFLGRSDDIITSAGYRIGPSEIEDCLFRHPAVASAGVVGLPDSVRTEIVAAFVVLRPGFVGSEELVARLQDHVRLKLGGHQYPRVVRFIEHLPLTVTGKIIRRALRDLPLPKMP
jgi:acetyl-CoA synthetase